MSCVLVLRSWMHSAMPPSSACFRYMLVVHTLYYPGCKNDAALQLGGAQKFYSVEHSCSDSVTASQSEP